MTNPDTSTLRLETCCEECGKPERDPKHIHYGPDVDNPVKHRFRAPVTVSRLEWERVHALLDQWKEVWNGDREKFITNQYPEWLVNAAEELMAHDLCDEWNWNQYVSAAAAIIARHLYGATPPNGNNILA